MCHWRPVVQQYDPTCQLMIASVVLTASQQVDVLSEILGLASADQTIGLYPEFCSRGSMPLSGGLPLFALRFGLRAGP